jgi:hypothetical protein
VRFSDPALQERLCAALSADEEFAQEARWFDGSILLEAGAERCWLKIYRGAAIDHLEFVPAFGYTFKVTGSAEAWDLFVSGERTFTDLATPGSRIARRSRSSRSPARATGRPSWRSKGTGSKPGGCIWHCCG